MKRVSLLAVAAAACASPARPFPMRPPMLVDTDTQPVSVPCRADPTPKEPKRMTCAPEEYVSPFVWDQVDNVAFARVSRALAVDVIAEAPNVNSLDEVADSAWFENRIGKEPLSEDAQKLGACKPADLIEDKAADESWVIDHGKDDGSTLGFRVTIPGKGQFMLKADDPGLPERASAASVIGASLYNAVGFNTSCEQIILVKRSQLKLSPGLKTISNAGIAKPFDEEALKKVLASSTQVGDRTRMQASKWLPGLALGPFRYVGVRKDDPNDIIPHQNRRELRGSRLLAAWMNHWDAREQNTMDLWFSANEKEKRSSPGFVRHYILDTSDVVGGAADPEALAHRLGHSYNLDFRDVAVDFITFGIIERPWDRAHVVKGREKFGVFSVQDFDPETWIPLYPNPAMLKMTERDAAWMARLIARITPENLSTIVKSGEFGDPTDAEYLTKIMLERQRVILARYLTKLSPLADVHAVGDQLCATDLARYAAVLPAERYHYEVFEHAAGKRTALEPVVGPGGSVCFKPQSFAPSGVADGAPERRTRFEVRNGTAAGPLEIHAYDLGPRGMFVAGLARP